MPLEFWVWELVKETGWTMGQVDALTLQDWSDWFNVRDAIARAKEINGRRK